MIDYFGGDAIEEMGCIIWRFHLIARGERRSDKKAVDHVSGGVIMCLTQSFYGKV